MRKYIYFIHSDKNDNFYSRVRQICENEMKNFCWVNIVLLKTLLLCRFFVPSRQICVQGRKPSTLTGYATGIFEHYR